jgi:DNA helicase IV
LFDETNDHEPRLTDWRAAMARPFYCATAANPEGVTLRRHFRTRGRTVVDFHDELFDSESATGEWAADTALLAALNAPRVGTMRDIVGTIQAEQDEIIRLDHAGVVVIEGGPGTGKTAVALHRVAYLLYTQRERLSRRGVLIIGPNPGFMRYIGDVLPSLGETDIVFATPGELLPGMRLTAEDPPETQRVKGSSTMVDVLAAAVADRQETPETPIEIELDDVTVPLDDEIASRARERARATGLLHNDARAVFRQSLIVALAERAVDLIGAGWLEPNDTEVRAELAADVRYELSANPQLRDAVDLLWPNLTPQRLLADLLTSRVRIDTAGAALDEGSRAALFRTTGDAWTVSDVPLLDEAVEFLGQHRSGQRHAEWERYERVHYAEGVLNILDTDEDPDGEMLRAVDLIDPEELSDRHVERDHRPLAERAAADRDWTYGHVILDEAQELSEMDCRVIMRRRPSRSITVVGDLAQRRSPAGAHSWGAMLDPYVADRWQYRALTLNYRTPAEIMEVAATVLAEVDPALRPPESVRRNGVLPWAQSVAVNDLAKALADAVQRETAHVGDGSVAVIAPDGTVPDAPVTLLSPHARRDWSSTLSFLSIHKGFSTPSRMVPRSSTSR